MINIPNNHNSIAEIDTPNKCQYAGTLRKRLIGYICYNTSDICQFKLR